MDINYLSDFLKKFEISEEKINRFIFNKKLVEVNRNIFLIKEKFEKDQIFGDGLIFIQLKKLLPSTYLLNFIKDNSENVCELKSEKQCLNFTYGKNLSFDSVKDGIRFSKGKYYLVLFEDKILGFVELNKNDKNFPLRNIMNIGEYLKES